MGEGSILISSDDRSARFSPGARPSPHPESFLIHVPTARYVLHIRHNICKSVVSTNLTHFPTTFGHCFLTLEKGDSPNETVAFGPLAGNRRYEDGQFPSLHPDIPDKNRIFEKSAKEQFCKGLIFTRYEGEVYDEGWRHSDAERVIVLTASQFDAVRERLDKWRKNPRPYQVAGLWGANCFTFAHDLVSASGHNVWSVTRYCPWPVVAMRELRQLARAPEYLLNTLSDAVTALPEAFAALPNVFAVLPEMKKRLFQETGGLVCQRRGESSTRAARSLIKSSDSPKF
jgi:hypothetical protein